MTTTRSLIFPLLVALASALGLWLAWESLLHHVALLNGITGTQNALCNISATFNCDAVNKSGWSFVLGLPVAAYGILYYLALLGGALLGCLLPADTRPRYSAAICAITALGLALSLALFFISKFIIGALCPLCLATYALNGVLFLTAWIASRELPAHRRITDGVRALIRSVGELVSPSSNRSWLTALVGAVFVALCGFVAINSPTYALQSLRAQRATQMSSLTGAEQKKAALERAVQSWQNAPVITLPAHIGTLMDYSKGPKDAAIQVVEFSDFQCPFCRNLYLSFETILERYKDKVRITLLNFPIDNSCNPQIPRAGHPFACYAASFAICAGEQGRFWDTAQYLFTLPELEGQVSQQAGIAAIDGAMLRLSLDADAMRACLASSRPAARLSSDVETAVAVGLKGTPLVIVNGRPVTSPTPDTLEAIFASIVGREPPHQAAKTP